MLCILYVVYFVYYVFCILRILNIIHFVYYVFYQKKKKKAFALKHCVCVKWKRSMILKLFPWRNPENNYPYYEEFRSIKNCKDTVVSARRLLQNLQLPDKNSRVISRYTYNFLQYLKYCSYVSIPLFLTEPDWRNTVLDSGKKSNSILVTCQVRHFQLVSCHKYRVLLWTRQGTRFCHYVCPSLGILYKICR
jgi:hypothetical protein